MSRMGIRGTAVDDDVELIGGNQVNDNPLVAAARAESEKIWIELGRPSPLDARPEIDAARRVYHAVRREMESIVAQRHRWRGGESS